MNYVRHFVDTEQYVGPPPRHTSWRTLVLLAIEIIVGLVAFWGVAWLAAWPWL